MRLYLDTAAALNLDYIALYFGQIKNARLYAIAHLKAMHNLPKNVECQTVVASRRHEQKIVEIVELGHNCFIVSPGVAHDLFQNDLTAAGVANF